MISLGTAASNLMLVALGDPYHPGQHSALNPASPQAGHIEWLYWLIFWILAIVFVLVMATLTAAARKSVTPVREILDISRENPGDKGAAWAVGTAIGITVITLLVILVVSIVTGKRVEAVPLKSSVTIRVRGHQWWWEITYPNSEPYLTVTTANEIHVPTGRPIVVLTDSADVIHSLWAPSIAGKRDLLPGIPTSFSFQVDKPGIYHGQCAEFCGLQHAHMGFAIIAESPEQFSAWYEQQLKPAAEPTNAEATRGRDVFLTHACVMCHTIRGTTAGSHYGPDLTHIASREMIAAETLPNVPGALAGWILDPQQVKPGNHMAPNILAPDDLQAVIAYLQSLQ